MSTGFDAVVAAAGASSRMGEWKPLLPWGASTVVETVVAAALAACPRVILVTGYRGEELKARFAREPRVVCVANAHWESGLASSVRAGAAQVGTERFFVMLADLPAVGPELYRAVAEAAAAGGQAHRPAFDGAPGHPVLFERSVLPRLAAWSGEGLRGLLATLDLRLLEVADPACTLDLDSPDDYQSALARRG